MTAIPFHLHAPVWQHARAWDLALRVSMTTLVWISGGVHLELAPGFSHNPGRISETTLFRLQGVVCLVVGAWLLRSRRRPPVLTAAAVAGVSLIAVLASVYDREARPGFFPVLYEPSWYFDKTLTAIAELLTLCLAAGVLQLRRAHRGQFEGSA